MISVVDRPSLDSLFATICEECLDDVGNGQVHYGKPKTIFGGLGFYEELVSRNPVRKCLE